MGRMLEALKQIEAKSGGRRASARPASKTAPQAPPVEMAPVVSPHESDNLCESLCETVVAVEDNLATSTAPAVDPSAVDALLNELVLAPDVRTTPFAALRDVPPEACGSVPPEEFEELADPVCLPTEPATSLAALAARLRETHAPHAPAVLLFCSVDGDNCMTLVERLATALNEAGQRPAPVLDAAGTYAARVTELRSAHRLVLLSGSALSDDALALCRYCDGVYLLVRLGAVSEAQLADAVARIEQFDGRLLGAVALQ